MAGSRASAIEVRNALLGWKSQETLKPLVEALPAHKELIKVLDANIQKIAELILSAFDKGSDPKIRGGIREAIIRIESAVVFNEIMNNIPESVVGELTTHLQTVVDRFFEQADDFLGADNPAIEVKRKETEKTDSFRLVKALLAKRLHIPAEQLPSEESKLLELIWALVWHQVSTVDIIEKSPAFAKFEFHTKKFNDLFTTQATSYDLQTILKEFKGGEDIWSHLNTLAWANNVGHEKAKLSNPKEKDGLEIFTKSTEMAPEHFRLVTLFSLADKPMIIKNAPLSEGDLVPENILRAPISTGEIIRQCVRWTLNERIKDSKFNPFTKPDLWRSGLKAYLVSELAGVYESELESDSPEEKERKVEKNKLIKAYQESTLLAVLPTLVYNFMEGLLFRSKFDTSALKSDGSFSEFVNFGTARGKLMSSTEMPISGGAAISGNPKQGSTGDFDFNIDPFVSLYVIPAEKYQLGFDVLPEVALMTSEQRELYISGKVSDEDNLIKQLQQQIELINTRLTIVTSGIEKKKLITEKQNLKTKLSILVDQLTNPITIQKLERQFASLDEIRNYTMTNGEKIDKSSFIELVTSKKSLIQWILDDRIDSAHIPIFSERRDFSPGNTGYNIYSWPSSYTVSELKAVVDTYAMAEVAKKGILGASGWLKLAKKQRRADNSEYVVLNGAEASKANGSWRSHFYYWAGDYQWNIDQNEYDRLKDFWFSGDANKQKMAQSQGLPIPLRGFERDENGNVKLDEDGKPIPSLIATLIPTHLYKFYSKEDLDEKLKKKEIDGYQYDLLYSQWMRITSDKTIDQALELRKCMFETQIVSELIEISEDDWDGDNTKSVLEFLSYEYWYFSTRTLSEVFEDMKKKRVFTDLDGQRISEQALASKFDLIRSFVEAKRSARIPIQEVIQGLFSGKGDALQEFGLKIEKFFPTVEDRRYEGLGQWTRSEAVMILRAARKDTLKKKKKK